MSWNGLALFISDVSGIILVIRLLSLCLHRVYRVFCGYLLFALLCSSTYFLESYVGIRDYRPSYLAGAVGTWVLTLWMVYALLGAILSRLPGILEFSHKLLIAVLAVAVLLALVAAWAEFTRDRALYSDNLLSFAVVLVNVIERAVTTVSLVSLLAILSFLLWFPVQLPRNLVLFSVAFIFNFVCETALLVLRGLLPGCAAVIDPINLILPSVCFGFLTLVITASGESVPVRLGHSWRPGEQERLFRQLEQINVALLKSVRS